MNPTRPRLVGLAAASALTALASCLDTAPVTVASPLSDAGESSEAATASCEGCLHAPDQPGPGCASDLAACGALPSCNAVVACAAAAHCFERGSLGAVEVCGLPCSAEAGLQLTGPEFTSALQVFSCAVGPCGPACGLADAGTD